MRISTIIAIACGFCSLFSACENSSINKFKAIATQNPQSAQIEFVRFDQEIFGLDQCIKRPAVTGNYDLLKVDIPDDDSLCLSEKINMIKEKHPLQFKHYMMMLDELSSGYDTPFETLFYLFLSNEAYHDVFQECIEKYEYDDDIKAEFTEAFARAQQLIPGYDVPQNIYLIYSGFGDYLSIDENTLYISLEYFLGADYKNYEYVPGIYSYQTKNLIREKIVPDAIYECTCEHFPMTKEAGNLLDHLLYYGKMLYVTDAIMHKKTPQIVMGYDDDEWEWCEKNETNMWNYLRENNLLFETDNKTITDFVIMSGSTKYFSTEKYSAPGRAAVWMGWQIISQYMKNNPDMSLTDLIKTDDSQSILQGSRYNP